MIGLETMARRDVQSILLDIYERMGKVETQNDLILHEQAEARREAASAREARAQLLAGQSSLAGRMDDFDGGPNAHPPYEGGWKIKLRDVATLKRQLAMAGVILFGAFQIIWFGLIYIKDIAAFIWDALKLWGNR